MTNEQLNALYYGSHAAASNGQSFMALTLWRMAEKARLAADYLEEDAAFGNNRRLAAKAQG